MIVPSYGRPARLRECLAALTADGESFPIVVVDDGSPEPLAPICAAFGPRVRCVRQANGGPAAARNAGVRATDAAFVAFTDDDCRPRPGWVAALWRAARDAPTALVGGRVENGLNRNVFAAASQSLCDYLYDYYGAGEGRAPFFTSNNMGCHRAAFEALGGFDETFPLAAAEDRDFGLRWRSRHGALVYVPDAVVEHRHALDMAGFWRQHRNYGRGARRLHEVMRARGETTPRREPIGFYLGLLAHPLRRPGRARLAQALLMTLSQAAMVAGYAAELRSERR